MKAVSAALVKAQKHFAPALKSSTNPHFKSRYADLSACVEAVVDALNEAGIMLMQKQHPNESGVSIETVFIHESGESISAGILSVPASKQDPQGYGSALTYARRYSLMAACGIAPEDDDGNSAKGPNIDRTLVMKVRSRMQEYIANDKPVSLNEEWEAAQDLSTEFATAVWSGLTTPERDYVRAARPSKS